MEHIAIENASPDLSFPWRLYILLRDAHDRNFDDVISWVGETKFQIHDPKRMESIVLLRYFTSNRYSSFRRQLIAYGFDSLGDRQCKVFVCFGIVLVLVVGWMLYSFFSFL
jgi:hypothetical protein